MLTGGLLISLLPSRFSALLSDEAGVVAHVPTFVYFYLLSRAAATVV
jgi:hypothetical protein